MFDATSLLMSATSAICWMLLQESSSACWLPIPVLAKVLQHVSNLERLEVCALANSAWHAASVLATSSVELRHPSNCASFTQWLKAHAEEAALESITASSYYYLQWRYLQLPVQQLGSLRKLSCRQLAFGPGPLGPSGNAESSYTALLPSELSGLTYVSMDCCPVRISALPAFTGLQHLCLAGSEPTFEVYGDHVSPNSTDLTALAEAVPHMQHLTHLELAHGYAQVRMLYGFCDVLRLLRRIRFDSQPHELHLAPKGVSGF